MTRSPKLLLTFLIPFFGSTHLLHAATDISEGAVLQGNGFKCQYESIDGQAPVLTVRHQDRVLMSSPAEGLWSVATEWNDQQPTAWRHARADSVKMKGPWLILTGTLPTAEGSWQITDSYRAHRGLIEGRRRWTWTGKQPTSPATLSVRFQSPSKDAKLLLPSICYYGNPAGNSTQFGHVPRFGPEQNQWLLCEEHRYSIPFASLEWKAADSHVGAALHSLPSPAPHTNLADQWWSLGATRRENHTEMLLLSGPCAMNGKWGVVKANQRRLLSYPDSWLNVPPGGIIEKTFFLEAYPVTREGSGFQRPQRSALRIHEPYNLDGLPETGEIVSQKIQFALSRWHENDDSKGFGMYPGRNDYVMGWAGQSDAPGYALLVLGHALDNPDLVDKAKHTLDFLATAPTNDKGFLLRYNPDNKQWSEQDPISQGQAMESFARAITYGRKHDAIDTKVWEAFLRKACDLHAERILREDWHPKSTNEGFLVSPLCKAHALFGNDLHQKAALKAAQHYGQRHLSMREPYWGGTLDARCEDKEGAWAAFQAFLAVYEMTRDTQYLEWAEHAMDVTLSYTYYWDVDLPAGRLRDFNLKTRGWTSVSVQNMHLDVFGVLYTPEVHRMGTYLKRPELQKLALLMYRSCGQLIDPAGSQGEQLQQTNFAQHGNLNDVSNMRGGYSEGWTVFWIAAHFLNAAAQFEEAGLLDDLEAH